MDGTILEKVNAYYDEWMFSVSGREPRFHLDKIGFYNVGYWKGVEDNLEMAQINLLETLLGFFTDTDGSVLDVACGMGASTRFLTKYFAPKSVTGINISPRQLEVCRMIAPACEFRKMDATRLEFGNASVDNVLCVEAAFHFMTRRKFLEEAYRVLKPGGRLAMSDFLMDYDALERYVVVNEAMPAKMKPLTLAVFPRENYLPSLDAYKESLKDIGFKYVRVEDMTELSWNALYDGYLMRRAEREFAKRRDYALLERYPPAIIAAGLVYAIK